MKQKVSLVFSLLIFATFHLRAQQGARFFDSDHEALFTVKEQKVYDSAGNVMLSMEGNIVFLGNSTSKEDMLYLLKSKGLFSNKISHIYDRKMEDVQYSIRNGKLFLGSELYSDRLIISVNKEGKRYNFYAGSGEQEVGYGLGELSEIELVGVMLAFTQRPNVKKAVGDIIDRKELIPGEGIVGIIKPAWETNFYREWSWDGRKLEPRWGNRPEDEWIFDGKKLVPYWGSNINIGFTWDGEVLRPTWGEDADYTFIYDGYTLRPYWGDETINSWVIEDDMARPKWINEPSMEYAIEGEVPVPVIALVVLGFADRK